MMYTSVVNLLPRGFKVYLVVKTSLTAGLPGFETPQLNLDYMEKKKHGAFRVNYLAHLNFHHQA